MRSCLSWAQRLVPATPCSKFPYFSDGDTPIAQSEAPMSDKDKPWRGDLTYGGMSDMAAERSWSAAQKQTQRKKKRGGDPLENTPLAESTEEFGSQLADDPPAEALSMDNRKALDAFPLMAFEDIKLDTERRGYLVKGLLSSAGLAVIWGPPKCGKSFWTTDLALHIALGWEYRGRLVQQAAVVYIALEGRDAIPARLHAFRHHHDVKTAPFYLLTKALNLIADVDALIASIQARLGETRPGAVFIDTLNRSLVGSESKDEDMARYLAAAGKIEAKFGCAVVIVHHCGIDGSRPRGHSSLSGAVEVQLAVKRGVSGEVVVTVELAKDFAEGNRVISQLEHVEVGTDPDGDPITSLVVVPGKASSGGRATARKLSDRLRRALETLDKCLSSSAGQKATADLELPTNTIVVPITSWREKLYSSGVLNRNAKNPREDFRRVQNDLQARGLIGVHTKLIWRA